MMASASESAHTEQHPYSGTTLAAVSDGLVKLHKDTCGRGPTNARTFASGDSVVCLLHGGLTRAERSLIAAGNEAAVLEQRRSLYAVMGPRARALVEELLGRRVTAMTLAADPANELETAVFLLDAPLDS
jgi:uncharacterized protein YbcI